MNRQQLERLGDTSLRQMALRIGLRGARLLDRHLLVAGLVAYFARLEKDEAALGAAEGAVVSGEQSTGQGSRSRQTGIPPALATETMARLLESQGRTGEAKALRARIGSRAGSSRADSSRADLAYPVSREQAAAVELNRLPQAEQPHGAGLAAQIRWSGAPAEAPLLLIRLWGPGGEVAQRELSLSSEAGQMRFEPPPETRRICAAMGFRVGDANGRVVLLARSAVLDLAADLHRSHEDLPPRGRLA